VPWRRYHKLTLGVVGVERGASEAAEEIERSKIGVGVFPTPQKLFLGAIRPKRQYPGPVVTELGVWFTGDSSEGRNLGVVFWVCPNRGADSDAIRRKYRPRRSEGRDGEGRGKDHGAELKFGKLMRTIFVTLCI